jgi:predicted tellurium resistance membrane protein TerC
MITRLMLLFSLTWIMRLTEPFFLILGHGVSGRDIILIVGGLFLLTKSTMEIHDRLEGEEQHTSGDKGRTKRKKNGWGGWRFQRPSWRFWRP